MSKKRWNKKLADYQRRYRAGKIKVDPVLSDGVSLSWKKRKNGLTLADMASFACPECGNNMREDLIRLRPEFYECRLCRHRFMKEESFDEFDDYWDADEISSDI